MITARDRYYIDLAFAQAVSSERVGGARLGALLVFKNKVIAFGRNQKKTHPFQAEYSKNEEAISLHAENDAIKNSLKRISIDDMSKATLFIARARKDGPDGTFRYGLAKPCSGCMRSIGAFDVRRVVYTTNEETIASFTRK